jgi:hypothetical protein
MNESLRGYTLQRKKAASAANNRLVLLAAVFVTESVGFRFPALPVCEGLMADGVLYKTRKHGDCSSSGLR